MVSGNRRFSSLFQLAICGWRSNGKTWGSGGNRGNFGMMAMVWQGSSLKSSWDQGSNEAASLWSLSKPQVAYKHAYRKLEFSVFIIE